MKAKITNESRALQGVHTADGLKFIEPGETRTLDVLDSYVERVKALPFLKADFVDPLDHDEDGKKGGSLPHSGEGYSAKTVAALRELASERNVDLGDATKKADIIAALELADEAAASE